MKLSLFKTLFSLFTFLFFSFSGIKAAIDPAVTTVPASGLIAGATFAVQDIHYGTPQGSWNFQNVGTEASVMLSVDPNYYDQVTGYGDVDFRLQVETFGATGSLLTRTYPTLTLNPNTSQTGPHRQLHLFTVNGAYRISVRILSIRKGSVNVTPPANMFMELNINAERYYNFLETNTVTGLSHKLWNLNGATPVAINSPVIDQAYSNGHEMEISWSAMPGAEEYQLEWTYLNNYDDVAGQYLAVADIPVDQLYFKNNSTRITTTALSYTLPLLYDRGYIAYRVRGIGRGGTNFSKYIPGAWTSSTCQDELDCFSPYYQRLSGHELGKNWQRTTTYAEEGKKKSTISYFDGTKRNRQSLVQNNSLKKSIVSETFYDYQGRPVIQTLPVPAEDEIKFYEGFNVHASGNEYLKTYYDVDIGNCQNPGAPQMNANYGSARYYSVANPDKTGQQAFLPEAVGYVFTQTEYTADNTGRIKRQGGAGADLKIGSGHETRYYYSTPDQEEIDRLFGTDVGYSNHYKKEVVIDPNGQATISYKDLRGQVIATGISGDSPAALLSLTDGSGNPLSGTATTPTTIDMFNKTTPGDVDDDKDRNFRSPDGRALTLNYTFIYTKEDSLEADYTLAVNTFTDPCLGSLQFSPVVDLDLNIFSDDCGTNLYTHSQTLGNVNASGSALSYTHPTIVLPDLSVGSYKVEKSLRVNEDSLDIYADLYADTAACLIPYQAFLDSAWNELDTADCDTFETAAGWYDCAACVASLGTQGSLSNAEWQALIDDCNAPCTYISTCEAIYHSMITDLMPGGQYATFEVDANGNYYSHDPLSIFNQDGNSAFPNRLPIKVTADYTVTPPTGGYDGNGSMNLNVLIPNWDPAWSHALISFHPEYNYKVSVCNNQETQPAGNPLNGEEYDWMLTTINTFSEAGNAQYLSQPSPGLNLVASFSGSNFPIMVNDPFYILSTPSEQTALRNILSNYKGSSKNIYDYAAQIAQCGNWFGNNQGSCSYTKFGTNADANILNQEWQLLQGFYLAAKQEFIYNKATVAALNISGIISNPANTGYFNGAIGHEKFNYFRYLIERYNINLTSVVWNFSTLYTLYYTYLKQLVSGPTFKLYEKKQKRVAFYDPYLTTKETETSENDADYEIYKKTGVCPLANDVKLLLNDLLLTNRIKPTSPQVQMLQVDGFTRDLYLQVTGFNDVGAQNYVPYKWVPVQNNSRKITASLNVTSPIASSVSNFIILEFHAQSNFNWTNFNSGTASSFKITRVRRLIPNGSNAGGYYGFAIEVDIEDANGVEYVEVLTGTIKGINLNGCRGSFNTIVHRSQMADDLEHLFNILASNNHFTSTAGVDVEQSSPPYIFPFQSSLEPVLDPSNTISQVFQWRKISNTIYEVRSSGTNRFLKIEFCNEPSFANGFDDVTFFENLNPMSLAITNSCIVDGRMANFNVDVVQIDQSNGTVISEQTLAGYAAIFIDEAIHEGPLDFGYYGSLTAKEDACEYHNEARVAFSEFMDKVMPADFSDHVYPNYGVFGSTPTPLPEILRDRLGTGVVFGSCPVSTDIAYMGLRVPTDPDHYVGMFWSHHGTPTSTPAYTISPSDSGHYDLTLDGCGHAYGYFDCPVQMEFVDLTQGYDFANVEGISHLEVDRTTLDADGFTNQFVALARMSNGSYVKVRGSSCFTFSDCSSCTPVGPEIPTNCWADYTSYENLVASITDDVAIPEEDFCDLNFSSCFSEYENYIQTMGVTDVNSSYYISLEDFCRNGMAFYLDYYFSYLLGFLNVGEISEIAGALPGEGPTPDNDLVSLAAFASAETGLVCVVDYLEALATGWSEGNILDYCSAYPPEYPCPVLDFKPFPETELDQNPCVEYYADVAQSNAQQAYDLYINQVKDDFKRRYADHIMTTAVETFKRYSDGSTDYHYTLYYYDQAGNLVRTVPPKGVNPIALSSLINVKAARDAINPYTYIPSHTLATKYIYNTLNQLESQTTPDGGTSDFWYDELGRLVLSRNARQNVLSGGKRRYSYSVYDELGRIIETGELETTASNPSAYLNSQNFPDNLATTRQEVTFTYYDQVALSEAQTYYQSLDPSFTFENLQNRVTAIAYYESYDATVNSPNPNYDIASHYSYDEHGNVKTLVQDKKGHYNANELRYKRMDYTYDLVSGNVKEVAYQDGDFDQLFHRYSYDADNRITEVLTSKDGVIWDTDASYDYYHHGPLARTELGEFKVQGMDLAYTLNGWLKTMNSSTLKVERDMREDDNSPTYDVARDAYAYSLHYFNGDYSPIGADGIGGTSDAIASISGMSAIDLHNGNIGTVVNSLWNTSEDPIRTHGNRYRYDQLNRLKEMDVFQKYSSGTDGVIEGNTFDQATLTTDYQVRLDYDANGNITNLERNGYIGSGNLAMDDLSYNYYAGTNRLQRVDDAVSAGNYTTDVDDQTTTNNYTYDATGNLISDVAEEIASITWTVGGKIKSINRTTSSTKPNLEFEYDGMGNRVTKIVKPRSGGAVTSQDQWTYTHYVRDASGNVMSIYEEDFAACGGCSGGATHEATVKVADQPIYGSDRLGTIHDDRQRTAHVSFGASDINYHGVGDGLNLGSYRERVLGNKDYELKNHLGNVQVTVADYKIWKTTLQAGDIFNHDFESAEDLQNWRQVRDAGIEFQEGSVLVTSAGRESGISQFVEGISSLCTYTYCITISELEPAPIIVHLTDQHGNTVVYEEINEPGEYCWEMEGLEEVEGLNIAILFEHEEGYFIVDHTSLSYVCPHAILIADVLSSQDYYPFGMIQPGRSYNSGNYRFGFNGMEKDDEIKGGGNSYDFGARIYDSRIGTWLSLDRKSKAYRSNYIFCADNPIIFIDPDGNDDYYYDKSTNSVVVFRTGAPHNFYTFGEFMPLENGPGEISVARLATDGEIGEMLLNNTEMFQDALKHATTREEMQKVFNYRVIEANKDNWKVAAVTVAIPILIIGTIEAAAAIGFETFGTYIVEETAETVIEELTGIPIIMDPIDIIEQGFKKVLRAQVKGKLAKEYGDDVIKGPGSYTITYADGTKYHGKGNVEEAISGAHRKSNGDNVTEFEWKPSNDNASSFRDEAARLNADGGHKSNTNRNQRDSPGNRKYKEE